MKEEGQKDSKWKRQNEKVREKGKERKEEKHVHMKIEWKKKKGEIKKEGEGGEQ